MIGSHEVCARADITYRQLDFWTRNGYLTPVPVDPVFAGTDYPREYPNDQVAIAREMSRLTKAGLPAKVAHDAALQLLSEGRARLGDYEISPAPTTDDQSGDTAA